MSVSGRFVVLVGPDGVGKTSVARHLVDASPRQSAYFHFVPSVRRPLKTDAPAGPGSTQDKSPKATLIGGWVRLARYFLRAWASYLVRIRPAVRQGTLVVGDRWCYGYLGQPLALRFRGPAWLARIAIMGLPKPDLVVVLTAPPDVIHARKPELTIDEIATEAEGWVELPVPRFAVIPTDRPPEEAAAEILDLLNG